MRHVPSSITPPPYRGSMAAENYTGSDVQPPEVIEAMRLAGRVAADTLAMAGALVAPGVTTNEIDIAVHEYMLDHGAYPATLDYRGFPKSVCTSVNEIICHGIPDARPLEDGDLVSLDVTTYMNGVHGDTCATFACGQLDAESQKLLDVTKEAMLRGIKVVKPGRSISVIGEVIEAYAKRFGFGVVREYTGHGVHTAFHSGLVILHYFEPRLDTTIEPGMTFTVEPMLTLGDPATTQWDDGWTVATRDGSRCAQFEHTIVVTTDGAEILTLPTPRT